ncbi:hypothetical protein TcWFU_003264 [Taenia crassiceps]|uniref:Uncharacterized protein n=1 Tax=Taenia crassiceps TaxID=6207 RepID=A0ABR4Q027_9CEST
MPLSPATASRLFAILHQPQQSQGAAFLSPPIRLLPSTSTFIHSLIHSFILPNTSPTSERSPTFLPPIPSWHVTLELLRVDRRDGHARNLHHSKLTTSSTLHAAPVGPLEPVGPVGPAGPVGLTTSLNCEVLPQPTPHEENRHMLGDDARVFGDALHNSGCMHCFLSTLSTESFPSRCFNST